MTVAVWDKRRYNDDSSSLSWDVIMMTVAVWDKKRYNGDSSSLR